MKVFKRKVACVLVAALGLMAGVAHAVEETGLVKIEPFATGSWAVEAAFIRMASPDPLKSGALCGPENVIALYLSGEGGQAIYKAVLEANINGKSMTVRFTDDGGGNCEAVSVSL